MLDTGLKDRVALVTGANHGIGAAIAKALAAQAARVFLAYYQIPPDGEIDPSDAGQPGMAQYALGRSRDASAVVSAIRAAGGTCTAHAADLSDPDTVPALFDRCEAELGPVDIVINNAAHWEPCTFVPPQRGDVDRGSTQWVDSALPPFTALAHDRSFAVNARAPALMMAEFARRQTSRGATWGRVINISTDAAYCFPSEAAYGASKLALESYSRTAASELGQFGITVNILSPGPIQTGYITAEMDSAIAAGTPLRRVGYPDDVADVAVFLASQQARWVTGQIIHVGGGHRM